MKKFCSPEDVEEAKKHILIRLARLCARDQDSYYTATGMAQFFPKGSYGQVYSMDVTDLISEYVKRDIVQTVQLKTSQDRPFTIGYKMDLTREDVKNLIKPLLGSDTLDGKLA